ncbi:hypothetical protein FACS189487_02920 [Campylobacterota bacterium]|nr:hypothetical protein FACS189487_02920 [Campylobacterota bacterium]
MRETRGAIAYRKRLERKPEPIQEKSARKKWAAEAAVAIAVNLSVWITGSGVIGAMLDNKDASSVILCGVFGMIGTISILLVIERISK